MASSRTPTVRQRRLGAELRRLREDRGMTGDTVADTLGWSSSKVSRIEAARIGARTSDVDRLLELYEVNSTHRDVMLSLAEGAAQRGWWERFTDMTPDLATFVALEADASACLCWDVQVIPGLLQTEAYARQIIAAWNTVGQLPPAEIERRVQVRLRRQQVLTGGDPLRLSIVLDESILFRQVADAATMRAQLEQLHRATLKPNVSLRIYRLNTPHALVLDSFMLLKFDPAHDITFPDVAHIESLTASHFTDEKITYLYQRTFEELREQAQGADESRALIAEACGRW